MPARGDSRARRDAVARIRHSMELDEFQLQRDGKIRSDYTGRAAEGMAAVGLEADSPGGELESVSYFPVRDGKKIQAKMQVQIIPDTMERERYGGILGKCRACTPPFGLLHHDFIDYLLVSGFIRGNRASIRGPLTRLRCSRQNLLDHVAMDIRQPEVAAGIAISQLLVIESHDVQDGGVEIVNVHGIFQHFVADVVCLAVDDAGFHTAAGEPDGKGAAAMIAVVCSPAALRPRCAAEFGAEDEQSILQQIPLLQILKQRRDRLVDAFRVMRMF